MNFNFLLIIILLLTSCTTIKSSNNSNKKIYNKFSNKGFTLIYSDSLFKDKIINKKLKETREFILLKKKLKVGKIYFQILKKWSPNFLKEKIN